MKVNTITNNSIDSSYSVLGSILWAIFFILSIQALVGVFSFLFLVSSGEDAKLGRYSSEIHLVLYTSILSILIGLPLFKKAIYKEGEWFNKPFPFEFLALYKINITLLVKLFFIGVGFHIIDILIRVWLDTPISDFGLEAESQDYTNIEKLILILSMGLVIPVYEELIFRGIMYSRLIKAGLSVKRTMVISTLLFIFLHLQFNIVDFIY